MPITDEYVDAVFRSIDKNHNNKIEPQELIDFAKVFVGSLVQEFTSAMAGAGAGAEEEEKKHDWAKILQEWYFLSSFNEVRTAKLDDIYLRLS